MRQITHWMWQTGTLVYLNASSKTTCRHHSTLSDGRESVRICRLDVGWLLGRAERSVTHARIHGSVVRFYCLLRFFNCVECSQNMDWLAASDWMSDVSCIFVAKKCLKVKFCVGRLSVFKRWSFDSLIKWGVKSQSSLSVVRSLSVHLGSQISLWTNARVISTDRKAQDRKAVQNGGCFVRNKKKCKSMEQRP